MAKIVTYSNTGLTCYSTIQLDTGDNVFISVVGSPRPSVTVYRSRMLGLRNTAIWEFNPTMAGGYDAYVRKMMRVFADFDQEPKHPLDAIKDLVLTCRTLEEVRDKLFAAERKMNTPVSSGADVLIKPGLCRLATPPRPLPVRLKNRCPAWIEVVRGQPCRKEPESHGAPLGTRVT
jgi:hypothetical protein